MREVQGEKGRAKARNVRWAEALWEGAITTSREEDRKEEVLWVLQQLAKDSRSGKKVREYVPW